MMERIRRMSKLEGLGSVIKHEDPELFYEKLESESKGLNTWKGELYFELHRGTYTSHGLIKKGNRTSEYLLRLVELLSSICVLKYDGFKYPKAELDRMWKLVLLNQFHDVLPGSSIGMVYEDALKFYADVAACSQQLIHNAIAEFNRVGKGGKSGLFNPTSWPFKSQVIEVSNDSRGAYSQLSASGEKALVFVPEVPPFGFCKLEDVAHTTHVRVTGIKY